MSKLYFADEKAVINATDCKVGNISLIGQELLCKLDEQLLDFDFIYGVTGSPYHTLKFLRVIS